MLTHHPKHNTVAPPPSTTPATSPVSSPSTSSPPPSQVTTSPPTQTSTPTSTATVSQVAAQNEAHQLDTMLSSGESSSELLATATTDAKNCGSPVLDNDVNEIRQVRDQRQAELNQAQGLNTADLPNGAAIQSSLIAALNDSLVVDADYLFWAQQQANPATCVWRQQPGGNRGRQQPGNRGQDQLP